MRKTARLEAALQGSKHYTGKPCKKNHPPKRYVSNGMCKVCACTYKKK